MKLIIDISDITYDSIMARDWKNAGWLFSEELKAIHDGTPLDGVLQEIRQEINDEFLRCDANAWSDVAKGLLSARCIIDKKIKDLVKESEEK